MRRRFGLTTWACSWLIAASLGCHSDVPEDPAMPPGEAGLEQQIALGRAGKTNRIEISEASVADSDLDSLDDQDEWIETIVLDRGVITDSGAESLARLPNLSHLRLRHSPIGNSGLRKLAQCASIRILNLPQSTASATGLAALVELPDLRNLRIGGRGFDADAAEQIGRLKTLRNVHLIGVPVDDMGLRQIASLPKLQSLYLDDSAVTQAGWDWLFRTHPQLHVHVNQKHLDRGHEEHQRNH